MNEQEKFDRLFCLDALRGLDMLLLTVIAPLFCALNATFQLPLGVMRQFDHPWTGFTLYDIIMPLFIFMCGAAIPFALERRLARSGGRPDFAYWKHVLGRFALLWALGLVAQGRILTFDPDLIRLYDNTLQSIALGYLVCAITIARARRMWVKIAVPAGCFILYGILLHALGDYSPTGNFAFRVEKAILTAIVPPTSETMAQLQWTAERVAREAPFGIEVHYTWYLTSLMFVFMTFCGYFATKILIADAPKRTKAKRLFAYGAVLLASGWILSACGVGMVKHIFTVSFTAQAMGWSVLALAILYVLTDILMLRRGWWLVTLFGQTALLAYMCVEVFAGTLMAFAGQVAGGVPRLLGKSACPLALWLVSSVLLVFILVARRAMKRKV